MGSREIGLYPDGIHRASIAFRRTGVKKKAGVSKDRYGGSL
jgi:hypothetical protein